MSLFFVRPPEHVVTTLHTLLESEMKKQSAKTIEADVGISRAVMEHHNKLVAYSHESLASRYRLR